MHKLVLFIAVIWSALFVSNAYADGSVRYIAYAYDADGGIDVSYGIDFNPDMAQFEAVDKCEESAHISECKTGPILPIADDNFWNEWQARVLACPFLEESTLMVISLSDHQMLFDFAVLPIINDHPEFLDDCIAYESEVGGQTVRAWLAGEALSHEPD